MLSHLRPGFAFGQLQLRTFEEAPDHINAAHQAPGRHRELIIAVDALQREGVNTIWGELLAMVILWRAAWATDKCTRTYRGDNQVQAQLRVSRQLAEWSIQKGKT